MSSTDKVTTFLALTAEKPTNSKINDIQLKQLTNIRLKSKHRTRETQNTGDRTSLPGRRIGENSPF